MNDYYQKALDFRKALLDYADNIFKTYGKELVLRLEEYNLLSNKNNCIESSTAVGFVLEEFLVSKLEMYTHSGNETYHIERIEVATTSESYDCFAIKDGIKFMVNIKVEKNGVNNNAVAALNKLYGNYCEDEPKQIKSYIVLKVGYSIMDGYDDSITKGGKPRHIRIGNLSAYNLEEIDFTNGHLQDNRSWSQNKSNRNNGRLGISNAFRQKHQLPIEEISYFKTFNMLEDIVSNNDI